MACWQRASQPVNLGFFFAPECLMRWGKRRKKKTLLQAAASQSVTAQCGIRVTGLLLMSTNSCFQTQVSKWSSGRQICPVAVPYKTASLPSLLVLFHPSAFWARHWSFSISLESHRNVGSGASWPHVLRYHILLHASPSFSFTVVCVAPASQCPVRIWSLLNWLHPKQDIVVL